MGILGWIFNSSSDEEEDDYSRGYNAANEFLDVLDHDLSDEEANAQWDAVESGHSQEYSYGYYRAFDDNSKPWWKLW